MPKEVFLFFPHKKKGDLIVVPKIIWTVSRQKKNKKTTKHNKKTSKEERASSLGFFLGFSFSFSTHHVCLCFASCGFSLCMYFPFLFLFFFLFFSLPMARSELILLIKSFLCLDPFPLPLSPLFPSLLDP